MSTTRVFVSYEQFVTDEYTYCLHCLLITMYSSTSSVINLMVITCATWQYHTSKMHQLGQYLDGGQGHSAESLHMQQSVPSGLVQ